MAATPPAVTKWVAGPTSESDKRMLAFNWSQLEQMPPAGLEPKGGN